MRDARGDAANCGHALALKQALLGGVNLPQGRRQRLIVVLHRRDRAAQRRDKIAALDGVADDQEERFRIPGFLDVLKDAALVDRAHQRLLVGVRGQKDAYGVGELLPHGGEKRDAVGLAHLLLADEHRRRHRLGKERAARQAGAAERLDQIIGGLVDDRRDARRLLRIIVD